EHLKTMKPGAVIVDVAVDQGGCVETIHATYHNEPIYIVDDIVHYGVANMPGVVALSSTNSLTSVTNRYGLLVADHGLDRAIELSDPIRHGVNLYGGKLTNRAVANATGLKFTELTS
ncbi:MAG: alanine dehydrogenase, partial [Planctomycetes bacterium]|nr:alanine dehydrogenase [Planctomycetota bacterium]